MTNTDDDPVQSLAYDPYGRTVFSAGSKNPAYQFTGQEKDRGTGLYYYGARYYDPELGRFIQADTVLDGLNRYTYCGNNPVMYVDPTGHYGEYSHPNEKPGSYDSYYQYYYGPIDGPGVFLVRNDDGTGYYLDGRTPDVETGGNQPDDFNGSNEESAKPPENHDPGNLNYGSNRVIIDRQPGSRDYMTIRFNNEFEPVIVDGGVEYPNYMSKALANAINTDEKKYIDILPETNHPLFIAAFNLELKNVYDSRYRQTLLYIALCLLPTGRRMSGGFPIGSYVIEGVCKFIFGKRFKRFGIWWKKSDNENVLTLGVA